MKTKSLARVEIKDADKGEVSAVFATFNVIDHDGDVTLPGAFDDGAPVRVSAYQHTSWNGALPVGKGVIRTTDTEAIAELKFFMDTQHGQDTFKTVKHMEELQEWSYGFDVDKISFGKFGDPEQHVAFLEKMTVHEVSPVLLGAGIGTRTESVKGRNLRDELSSAMDVVDDVIGSVERVVALRAEKGKGLSQINRDSLGELTTRVERLKSLLESTGNESAKIDNLEFEKEWLRAVAAGL